MKYSARKFNKNSYAENDNFAKNLFIEYIKKMGHNIINTNENFEHDIITEKNGLKYFFETEVKIGYPFELKESFKFNTVSFLGRKKRLHDINPFFYVIICKETKYALCSHSNIIFKDEYFENVYVNSKDRKGNDGMYRVPLDKCKFFYVGNEK